MKGMIGEIRSEEVKGMGRREQEIRSEEEDDWERRREERTEEKKSII
jgi:hypothetical protein